MSGFPPDQPETDPNGDDSGGGEDLLPVAAVICIVIGVFIFLIVLLLIIRKCFVNRGMKTPSWFVCPSCSPECSESCKELAERLDCSTPDCRVWLDSLCPSKQQCALCCGQLWSCYCCYMLAASCEDIHLCPDCQAPQCPDCDCGNCCHCALRPPECSQITCLCFECGRPPEQ